MSAGAILRTYVVAALTALVILPPLPASADPEADGPLLFLATGIRPSPDAIQRSDRG